MAIFLHDPNRRSSRCADTTGRNSASFKAICFMHNESSKLLRDPVQSRTCCWRRLDFPGLELLQLRLGKLGQLAHSSIIDGGPGQFSLQIDWTLNPAWGSRALKLTQHSRGGVKTLRIKRGPGGWAVDDKPRPDLSDCIEVDVSATPFCNGLALHALGHKPGELTTLYVDASDLSVQPSRQRYERLTERKWRYIDLGVASGFEAVLDFDDEGLVTRYEGLFELLTGAEERDKWSSSARCGPS